MAAGARRHGDQAVGALLDRLARMAVVDHVVQHDAAIGVDRLVDLFQRTERRDHDRHLVFDAHFEVVLQAAVRLVHDLVDGERRRRTFGVGGVMAREFFRDLRQPLVELRLGARVEGRKRTDHARLALRQNQGRMRDDEQRRADDGDAEVALEDVGKGHGGSAEIDVSVNVIL